MQVTLHPVIACPAVKCSTNITRNHAELAQLHQKPKAKTPAIKAHSCRHPNRFRRSSLHPPPKCLSQRHCCEQPKLCLGACNVSPNDADMPAEHLGSKPCSAAATPCAFFKPPLDLIIPSSNLFHLHSFTIQPNRFGAALLRLVPCASQYALHR